MSGDRIKQAREIAGLSIPELAIKVGVSDRLMLRWECDFAIPTEYQLQRLGLATGGFPPAFFKQEPGPEFPLGSLLYHDDGRSDVG